MGLITIPGLKYLCRKIVLVRLLPLRFGTKKKFNLKKNLDNRNFFDIVIEFGIMDQI